MIKLQCMWKEKVSQRTKLYGRERGYEKHGKRTG